MVAEVKIAQTACNPTTHFVLCGILSGFSPSLHIAAVLFRNLFSADIFPVSTYYLSKYFNHKIKKEVVFSLNRIN